MKRVLPLLLLVGALIGLFGQGIAYASAPAALARPGAAAQSPMSSDCAQMMHQQQPQPGKRPCKGLTFDCIAAMGCLPPLFLGAGGFWIDDAGPTIVPPQPLAVQLPLGENIPPDLHPPSNLA